MYLSTDTEELLSIGGDLKRIKETVPGLYTLVRDLAKPNTARERQALLENIEAEIGVIASRSSRALFNLTRQQ